MSTKLEKAKARYEKAVADYAAADAERAAIFVRRCTHYLLKEETECELYQHVAKTNKSLIEAKKRVEELTAMLQAAKSKVMAIEQDIRDAVVEMLPMSSEELDMLLKKSQSTLYSVSLRAQKAALAYAKLLGRSVK